jgi:hypothetical protein
MEQDIRGSIDQEVMAYTAGNGYVKISYLRRIFAQPQLTTEFKDSIYCVKVGEYAYTLTLE